MERANSNSRGKIRQLVIVGMLSSISIFLGMTGLGFLVIGPVKATIMHIPVIIGAILEGPIVGGLVGLCFGLFSMYQAITAPTPTSFVLLNPIISLLPRILLGVGTYYIFTFLKTLSKGKVNSFNIGISAVTGTFINTIGVLGLTYLFYIDAFAKAINISSDLVGKTILVLGATNGIPEAILSALITIPVVLAIKKARR